MKPSGDRLLNDPIASFAGRIRRTVIAIGRLIRGPLRRLSILASKRLQRAAQSRRLQSLGAHMLADIGLPRRDAESDIRLGWPSGAVWSDHYHPLSYDLYFHARRERTETAGHALKSAFAKAVRHVRRRSRRRDGNRHCR